MSHKGQLGFSPVLWPQWPMSTIRPGKWVYGVHHHIGANCIGYGVRHHHGPCIWSFHSTLSLSPLHCTSTPNLSPPLHHTQLLQHVLFEYQFSLHTNTAERHAVAKHLWHTETLLRSGAPVECMLCQCAWAIWLSSAKVCSEPAAQSVMWMGSVPLYVHITYVSEHYQ